MRKSVFVGVVACLVAGSGGECLAAGPSPAAASDMRVEPGSTTTLVKDPNGCTWMESQAAASAESAEGRPQARLAAIHAARRSSIREFLRAQGLSPDHDGPPESVLRAGHMGPILMENAVSEKYDDLPGCAACRYRVTLRDCLTPLPRNSDQGFRVDLEVSRAIFIEGDRVQFTVTPSRETYIYLYDVRMNGQATLVAPNLDVPLAHLKAGETWKYPPRAETLRRGVLSLVAELPGGKTVSEQTIRVIASKTPLSEKITDPTSGGYLGVLRRLNVSRMQWAEDSQEFTIAGGEAGSAGGNDRRNSRPPDDSPALPSDQEPAGERTVPLLR